MAHLHLPKPLHGWREFAGEVGIIVLGVLIALSAEQLVERLHKRAQLRSAQDAMVAELRDDDLPQAYIRAAVFNCYADQLDATEAGVASGDRAKVLALASAYHPVGRTWDDEAWKAAIASQVLVDADSKVMIDWSSPYVTVSTLETAAVDEQDEVPRLWAKLGGSGPLTSEQQDRLLEVISLLRRHNRHMTGASLRLMGGVGQLGLTLTPKQKADLLAEARRFYGACASEPPAEVPALRGQFSVATDQQLGRR